MPVDPVQVALGGMYAETSWVPRVGSAGSSSASRQTWMTGGAVRAACVAVRERVLELAASKLGRLVSDLVLAGGAVAAAAEGPLLGLADLLVDRSVEETRVYRHRPTFPLDPETGQGEAHVAFAFAAHRAVVDVDTELGLIKVVEIATAQDVGRALNPQAVEGQIEGGIAQGLGLALMEEIQMEGGRLRNPSFTDYLIPTVLDMPPVRLDVLEMAEEPFTARLGYGGPLKAATAATGTEMLARAAGRRARLVAGPALVSPMGGIAARVKDHTVVAAQS